LNGNSSVAGETSPEPITAVPYRKPGAEALK
jgi:hypothetical protein